MAIAFVQSSSASASSKAFIGANTFGNVIIVLATKQAVTTFGCSDTNSNIYQPLTLITNDNNSVVAQIFYSLGIKAGANTVSASSADMIAIHEFSGINSIDVNTSATGTGNSQNSGNITTNFANELLFGFECANSSLGQATVTKDAAFNLAETSANTFLTQYRIVSSTGTFSSTTTTTASKGGTVHWIEQIASFYLKPNRKAPIFDFGLK